MPVGVDRDHGRTARLLEARGKGRRLPEVAAQTHHYYARVRFADLLEDLHAIIAAAIIHGDDLVGLAECVQHRCQFGV